MISPLTPNNSQNNILTPGDSTPARFGDVNRVIRDINAQFASPPPEYISFIADGVVTNNLTIQKNTASYLDPFNTPCTLCSIPIYEGVSIQYYGDEGVSTITFPLVETLINWTSLNGSGIVNFPNLIRILGVYSAGSIFLNVEFTYLNNISFPLLEVIFNGYLHIHHNNFTTLTFPNLKTILYNNVQVENNNNLTYLSFPSLVNGIYNNFSFNNNALISISFSSNLKSIDGLSLTNNRLSTTSVNDLLSLLVSLDGTNGTTLWNVTLNISGGSNAVPSGQGITDVATLVARGATIYTN
jgi:hypothetical protein